MRPHTLFVRAGTVRSLCKAMPQTSSFFELAALLIPVLMLSGFITQQLERPEAREEVEAPGRTAFKRLMIVALFGLLPAFAELFMNTVSGRHRPAASRTRGCRDPCRPLCTPFGAR